MRYYFCMYDLEGNLMGARNFSCLGCGWKHRIKHAPCCLRKGSKGGQIVRRNAYFIKMEKDKKWVKALATELK